MADKRQVRRNLRRLQYIKTWQLLILLFLMGFVAATFLRLNNIGMEQRRDAVLQADKTGDKNAVKGRLYDLQRYVTAHMNTNMGSIYLENQYKQDSRTAIDAASGVSNPNGNIFKKAQEICAPKYKNLGGYSLAYQQCVINQLNKYPSAASLQDSLRLPKADAYRFSFVSPVWSPDFAGFSVLICGLIILMILGRLAGLLILKALLKRRNRGL